MSTALFTVILATSVGFGERTARNGVAFELGGPAGIYSLSYERFVTDDFALRVGLGGLRLDSHDFWYAAVPVTASYLVGAGAHALELGAGLTFFQTYGDLDIFSDDSDSEREERETSVVFGALAGYRYAPRDGGFTLRLAATPYVRFEFPFVSSGIWAGFLVGYMF